MAILTTVLCCCPVAVAQHTNFKKALQKGREEKKFYVWVNPGNGKTNVNELYDDCKKYDYISGKYSYKTINRFGDQDESVGTFEFLPRAEVPSYLLEYERQNSNEKYINLMQSGLVYLPMNKNSAVLTKVDNAKWSGQLNDGMLHGGGYGIIKYGEKYYYYNGVFSNGIPQGNLTVKAITVLNLSENNWSVEKYSLEVSPESEGLHRVKFNGKYGYYNKLGELALPAVYTEASNFDNGQARVTGVYETEQLKALQNYRGYNLRSEFAKGEGSCSYFIDTNGNFKEFTAEQKKIFDQKLPAGAIEQEEQRLIRENLSQEFTVRGVVTNSKNNEPIIGATLQVNGTNRVTATDADGKFSIMASNGEAITAKYVGMEPVTVKVVAGKNNYDIALKEPAKGNERHTAAARPATPPTQPAQPDKPVVKPTGQERANTEYHRIATPIVGRITRNGNGSYDESSVTSTVNGYSVTINYSPESYNPFNEVKAVYPNAVDKGNSPNGGSISPQNKVNYWAYKTYIIELNRSGNSQVTLVVKAK